MNDNNKSLSQSKGPLALRPLLFDEHFISLLLVDPLKRIVLRLHRGKAQRCVSPLVERVPYAEPEVSVCFPQRKHADQGGCGNRLSDEEE